MLASSGGSKAHVTPLWGFLGLLAPAALAVQSLVFRYRKPNRPPKPSGARSTSSPFIHQDGGAFLSLRSWSRSKQ